MKNIERELIMEEQFEKVEGLDERMDEILIENFNLDEFMEENNLSKLDIYNITSEYYYYLDSFNTELQRKGIYEENLFNDYHDGEIEPEREVQIWIDNGITKEPWFIRSLYHYLQKKEESKYKSLSLGNKFDIVDKYEYDSLRTKNYSLASDHSENYYQIYGMFEPNEYILGDRIRENRIRVNNFQEMYELVKYYYENEVFGHDLSEFDDYLEFQRVYIMCGLDLVQSYLIGEGEDMTDEILYFIEQTLLYSAVTSANRYEYNPKNELLSKIHIAKKFIFSLWSDEYIVTNNFPEILGMIEDTGIDLKEELNEYINKTYAPKIIDTYNKQNLVNEEVEEVEEVEETKED